MSEPPASPFDELIGTEWGEMAPERATATLAIHGDHMQPFGVVHGGVYCALAESVTSRATAKALAGEGVVSMGQSNQSSFLRPATEGTIHVEAQRRHAGRTSWIWDVEITNDDGRLCALSRVTIAVRPAPAR